VGLDRDAEILARTQQSLEEADGGSWGRTRVRTFHLVYSRMREALDQLGIDRCDRVLLDLGVSSLHLDSPERGFSFMHDALLDMRMDTASPLTAALWLRRVKEPDLARTLFELGEERNARRIARCIVAARERGEMTRTSDLVRAVQRAAPRTARRQRIHPATRTFQAIRMAVNDELGELQRGLEASLHCLSPSGRLAVISFHSLEDRTVKQFMRARMRPLTAKPVQATAAERRRNPRSRSAKLRCAAVRQASPAGEPTE
jgi:16S rRNA (cytosine1402-N4)-methyltransferase